MRKSKNKEQLPIIYNWKLYQQVLISFVLFIVIFIVINECMLNVKIDNYMQTVGLEDQLKEEYINKYAVYKSLAKYQLQSKKLAELNNQLMHIFPNETDMENLNFAINQLSQNNFMTVKLFQPQDAIQDVAGLNLQIIKVNLSGGYVHFVNFMLELSKLSQVIYITNLVIDRQDNENITANFNLNIHFKHK